MIISASLNKSEHNENNGVIPALKAYFLRHKIICVIVVFLYLYVFINFYFSLQNFISGTPEIIDGKYVINDKGNINEINKELYSKLKYMQIRMYSGFWILFSIIPMFYFRERQLKRKSTTPPQAAGNVGSAR